jgi:hypothetical protein
MLSGGWCMMNGGGAEPSVETERELRALLGVVRGLRTLAEGRLAGLAIAPGEYLADIYCIQRVATLLAMELSAVGRSLRRAAMQEAGDEIHAIEAVLAAALERRRVTPDDCVLALAEATVVRRDGSPV